MFKFRKPKLRISKKGKVSFGGGGVSVGGKNARVNISKSGASTSGKAGPASYNSKRGWSLGCAVIIIVGLSLGLLGTRVALAQNPTPTAVATPVQFKATTLKAANLRAGPATTFAVVGSVKAKQSISITGKNAKGDWYQLTDGKWIAVFLVSKVVGNVPVVAAATIAPAAPLAPAAPTATPVPVAAGGESGGSEAFVCTNGCATRPNDSCNIKGNVNSKKDHIYHIPGWRDYNKTNVKPEEGDRWFCTEAEAVAAGFRAPLNH
jgi:hypothetical protein